MIESDDDPVIHICAGPPICILEGDVAIAACQNGCPFCKHITLLPDGSELVTTGHGTA